MNIAQSRVELEDPDNCTASNDVLTVFEALFEALVRFAPGGGFEPGLAERWTVSEDARVWTFFLWPGWTLNRRMRSDSHVWRWPTGRYVRAAVLQLY